MKEPSVKELEATAGEAPAEPAVMAAPPGSQRIWDAIYRNVPAFDSLRTYSWKTFRADLFSGLTVAAVAVPQAMAYALIVGVDPKYGLYTAIVMTAVGALFDSSKQLINGPTNAISIALFSALSGIAAVEDKIQVAVLLALLIGLVQTGITLLRLGDLTRYISHAVIVGFTVGASVLLVLDQLKNLLGLPAQGEAGHFLVRFWLTLQHGTIHGSTALVGLGSIAFVLVLRWVNNRLGIHLPELLLAVAGAALVVWLTDLHQAGVKVIGDIPASLPGFMAPTVEWERVRDLSGSVLAIAVLGLLEAIAMAKAIAAQTGQRLDINQQCLSEGLANIAGSFFQCFPGSGSLTRSAINQQTGAATQWSGVISAVAVAATVLAFADFARYIPRAALAGILMVTAMGMIDRQQLMYHLGATRFDRRIVIATALAAVLISVEFCILIGVLLSFVLYVPRVARVRMSELTLTRERVIRERVEGDPPCGRLLIFDLEGELFFGSAPNFEEHLALINERAGADIRVVVLRLKRARNPDAVCLGLLGDFVHRLQQRKITVLLCGVQNDLAKALRNTGLEGTLGTHHIFREGQGAWSSTLDAVRFAYGLLANDVCATCPRRDDMPSEPLYYMI